MAEVEVLRKSFSEVVTLMSTDLSHVKTKAFAKKLISLTREEEEAQKIMENVFTRVEAFPEEFHKFMDVLKETPSLEILAERIEKEYEKLKVERKTTKLKRSTQLPSHSDSSDDNQENASTLPDEEKQKLTVLPSPDKPARFPYLKTETLTKKEKERLKTRLKIDSDEQKDRFAILVDQTRESLEKQNVVCDDLSVLVRHSTKNRLIGLIQDSKSIRELLSRLADYWSFFDYEFLSLIIKRFCKDLKPDLTDYESSLKEYCRRRLCELPDDVFANRGDGHNLYVKIDSHFDSAKVEDIKRLEVQLSKLLETELYILKVEEGCIFVTFTNVCDFSTPLSPYQITALKEMKILHLYSDTEVYLSNKACDESVDTLRSAVAAISHSLGDIRNGIHDLSEQYDWIESSLCCYPAQHGPCWQLRKIDREKVEILDYHRLRSYEKNSMKPATTFSCLLTSRESICQWSYWKSDSLKRERFIGSLCNETASFLPQTQLTRKERKSFTNFRIDFDIYVRRKTPGEKMQPLELLHNSLPQIQHEKSNSATSSGTLHSPDQTMADCQVSKHSREDLETSLPDKSPTSDHLSEQGAQSSDTNREDEGSDTYPFQEATNTQPPI